MVVVHFQDAKRGALAKSGRKGEELISRSSKYLELQEEPYLFWYNIYMSSNIYIYIYIYIYIK